LGRRIIVLQFSHRKQDALPNSPSTTAPAKMDFLASYPIELAALSASERATLRNQAELPKQPRAVVYWMQRAQRIGDNPALELAIEAANLLGLPCLVYFTLIPSFPGATLRPFRFLLEGLREVAEEAAERGLRLVIRRPPATLEGFLAEVDAALLVGDENPCREPARWRAVLAQRVKIPYVTVDADVVVPSRRFNRSFVLLHHFRPHLKRALPEFLVAPPEPRPLHSWPLADEKLPGIVPEEAGAAERLWQDFELGLKGVDASVAPTESFHGGPKSARRQLESFLQRGLRDYDVARNLPERDGTSRLSPWLHFGHIGPREIAWRAAQVPGIPSATLERFHEELIGWRELAVLFVRHTPNYDNWECAAEWARKSLTEHASDPRPYKYSYEQLDRAETHDELWNAAQLQMTRTGWMHGYLRMYWAKKILEWSPHPEVAFTWAVALNDRYQLDGRDPNGYAGVAWAVVGRHDRPWFNRPVFGLIRTMTGNSIAKKFDAGKYIRQQGNLFL